jgi:hypothetical protein
LDLGLIRNPFARELLAWWRDVSRRLCTDEAHTRRQLVRPRPANSFRGRKRAASGVLSAGAERSGLGISLLGSARDPNPGKVHDVPYLILWLLKKYHDDNQNQMALFGLTGRPALTTSCSWGAPRHATRSARPRPPRSSRTPLPATRAEAPKSARGRESAEV